MTDLHSLITGLISFSLLKGVSFQEVRHLSNMYLFMNGLRKDVLYSTTAHCRQWTVTGHPTAESTVTSSEMQNTTI